MFLIALSAAALLNPPLHLQGRGTAEGGGGAARSAETSKQASAWTYEEPGNNCTATRSLGRDWVQLRLTRWRDLSDSILFHRPDLAPLWSEDGHPSGRTPAQEEADAAAAYHFEVRIDGRRRVEAVDGFHGMVLDYQGRPGPTYRFGIRQQPFLQALRTGRILELYRAGQRLARIPINGLTSTARRMAACVALPVR